MLMKKEKKETYRVPINQYLVSLLSTSGMTAAVEHLLQARATSLFDSDSERTKLPIDFTPLTPNSAPIILNRRL